MSASRFHRSCSVLGVCQAREPACSPLCIQRPRFVDIDLNTPGVLQRVDTSPMAHDDGVSVGGLCTENVCEGHPDCTETHCDNHPDNPGEPVPPTKASIALTTGTLWILALLLTLLFFWPQVLVVLG